MGQAAGQGADIAVYSLTKYAGGHSDLVAGGLSAQALHRPVRAMRNTMGGDLRSQHRVDAAAQPRDARAAHEPRGRECRQGVRLPPRPSQGRDGRLSRLPRRRSRQADIYDRHCTGAGSTFSLYLKGGEREAFAFLDALKIAKLAVSLGGTETLASAPAAMTHLSVPDERKAALGISDNLVRISIGVEKADDLIADFEHALRAV